MGHTAFALGGRRRRPSRAVPGLIAVSIIVFGCADEATSSTRDDGGYTERADQICGAGRDRLRAEPRLRDSTVVLADMERQLRALGPAPAGLDALGDDVAAALARITWAAEAFNNARRYELNDTTITLDEVREAGFRICGTQ